jgi:hypothetical protein
MPRTSRYEPEDAVGAIRRSRRLGRYAIQVRCTNLCSREVATTDCVPASAGTQWRSMVVSGHCARPKNVLANARTLSVRSWGEKRHPKCRIRPGNYRCPTRPASVMVAIRFFRIVVSPFCPADRRAHPRRPTERARARTLGTFAPVAFDSSCPNHHPATPAKAGVQSGKCRRWSASHDRDRPVTGPRPAPGRQLCLGKLRPCFPRSAAAAPSSCSTTPPTSSATPQAGRWRGSQNPDAPSLRPRPRAGGSNPERHA